MLIHSGTETLILRYQRMPDSIAIQFLSNRQTPIFEACRAYEQINGVVDIPPYTPEGLK